jgi:hypothetical protein
MMVRYKLRHLKASKLAITFLLSSLLAVTHTSGHQQQHQAKPPIEKEGLLRALRQKALTEKELLQEIKSRGVNFRLATPSDENDIRRAGSYLGRRGLNNLIDAVRNNFRQSVLANSGQTGRRPDIYRVRVTIVDPQRRPIDDAKVWSTIGGEPKKVAGGWQFDIPAAGVPADGKVTFYASKENAYLDGESNLQLDRDSNPVVTITMTSKTEGVVIRGIVVDEANNAIGEVRVNVVGYESEAVITQANGGFVLPAHAAISQQILLHAEKPGYKAVNQYAPAGDESATIILEKR